MGPARLRSGEEQRNPTNGCAEIRFLISAEPFVDHRCLCCTKVLPTHSTLATHMLMDHRRKVTQYECLRCGKPQKNYNGGRIHARKCAAPQISRSPDLSARISSASERTSASRADPVRPSSGDRECEEFPPLDSSQGHTSATRPLLLGQHLVPDETSEQQWARFRQNIEETAMDFDVHEIYPSQSRAGSVVTAQPGTSGAVKTTTCVIASQQSSQGEPIESGIGDPTETGEGVPCDICGRTFLSRHGLTTHRRMKHPDAQNASNKARIESMPKGHKRDWLESEMRRLVNFTYGKSWSERRDLFPAIEKHFPGRNANALDRACYADLYKALWRERADREDAGLTPEAMAEDDARRARDIVDDAEAEGDRLFRAEFEAAAVGLAFGDDVEQLFGEHVDQFVRGEVDIEIVYQDLQRAIPARSRPGRRCTSSQAEGSGEPSRQNVPQGDTGTGRNQTRPARMRVTKRRDNSAVIGRVRTHVSSKRTQRNQRKLSWYAKHQDMWRKNRRALWKYIKDGWPGESSLQVGEAHEFWSGYFGRDSIRDDEELRWQSELHNIWRPLTLDEITEAVKHQKEKAPGPDGVDFDQVRRTSRSLLTLFLNMCLWSGTVPRDLKRCRTVLIPKKNESSSPAEHRPITMSSILIRVLQSVLAKRISSTISLHPCQRGFITADGCHENTLLLDWAMRTAIAKNLNQTVMLLDVRKAFDSVSHCSIVRALEHRGMSERIVRYITSTMFECETRIEIGGAHSDWFPMTCGVKQGDPLSPVFFNLVIDELLHKLDETTGFGLGTQRAKRLRSLAFADDLVLVTESAAHMAEIAETCESFYRKRGMTLNGDKTVVLNRVSAPKAQTSALSSRVSFTVGGSEPRVIAKMSDTFTYLGIKFNPNGKVDPNREALGEMLGKLEQSPLKPEQKMFYLRTFLLPTLFHEAVLSRVTTAILEVWDQQVKSFVKRILYLPRWAIDGYIYLPVRKAGLGIPRLRYTIPRLLLNRCKRLQESNHPLIPEWLKTAKCVALMSTCEKLLKVQAPDGDWDLSTKRGSENYWLQRTRKTYDGEGVDNFLAEGAANNWIYAGSKVLSGKMYVRAVQSRFEALPIGANAVRHLRGGRQGVDPSEQTRAPGGRFLSRAYSAPCRYKCKAQETLCHATQSCHYTRKCQTQVRHDALVRDIAQYLKDKGYHVESERRFTVEIQGSRQTRIPDLVVYDTNGHKIYILDVTCPYETKVPLNQAATDKSTYYVGLRQVVSDHYKNRFTVANMPNPDTIPVVGLAFGARGGIAPKTFRILNRNLGVPKRIISLWGELTIFRTMLVYQHFQRGSRWHRLRGHYLGGPQAGGEEEVPDPDRETSPET